MRAPGQGWVTHVFCSVISCTNPDQTIVGLAPGLGQSALAMLVLLLGAWTGEPARGQRREWMFGPFEKPKQVNPAIAPSRASTFLSPMNDSSVHWEEYATFNPAAVVKDGKVYVLYRAEDATGDMKIGGHTSRIGLAEIGRASCR